MGCGSVEKRAIVLVIWVARDGFVAYSSGIGETPMHDVSILVFDGLIKQPSLSPFVFRVSQRKGRSGR